MVSSIGTFIIYKTTLKIKQEIGISWILKYKTLQLVSNGAMLGCRYPMVSTSLEDYFNITRQCKAWHPLTGGQHKVWHPLAGGGGSKVDLELIANFWGHQ